MKISGHDLIPIEYDECINETNKAWLDFERKDKNKMNKLTPISPILRNDILKISDQSSVLPEGYICSDCANKNHCSTYFAGFNDKDEVCGFNPSKFQI